MFLGTESKPKKSPVDKPKKKRFTAPKGNKFYLLRSKDGRDRIYPTPESLWIACCDYFQYAEENPLEEERAFSTKMGIKKVKLNKLRAMTLAGLRVHLGICRKTYDLYRKRPGYEWVTNAVDDVIYSQKFEGAAAGMLNANIIARDLGLSDKKELSGGLEVAEKKNFNDFYDEE